MGNEPQDSTPTPNDLAGKAPGPAPTTDAAPVKGENTPDPAVNGSEKTFTQADLDRLINERLGREKAKYAGFDDFKAKASKFDALAAALGGTEAEPDPEQLKATLTQQGEQLWAMRVERAVEKAARAAGADPELTTAVLFHSGALDDLDPGSDSYVDAVKAAVEKALENNPRLAATGGTGPDLRQGVRTGSASVGQLSEADLHGMSPAEVDKARKEGRLDRLLGKSS